MSRAKLTLFTAVTSAAEVEFIMFLIFRLVAYSRQIGSVKKKKKKNRLSETADFFRSFFLFVNGLIIDFVRPECFLPGRIC